MGLSNVVTDRGDVRILSLALATSVERAGQ